MPEAKKAAAVPYVLQRNDFFLQANCKKMYEVKCTLPVMLNVYERRRMEIYFFYTHRIIILTKKSKTCVAVKRSR